MLYLVVSLIGWLVPLIFILVSIGASFIPAGAAIAVAESMLNPQMPSICPD
ncbi:MAG: hypothetical protein HY692_00580 [Cyanobacteria bacterium NC_groundwater_1444_Ag_S-0.65um_54_12]|nr:hypothetical protein [Cyanobacteria bacterium NC_groundwater_1444_Ag_S-0.65um_54_12]